MCIRDSLYVERIAEHFTQVFDSFFERESEQQENDENEADDYGIVHGCFGYFFRREPFGYGDYGFLQVFQRIGLFQGSASLESMYISRHENLGSTGGRLGLRGICLLYTSRCV